MSLLKPNDVAAQLGCSTSTIRRLVNANAIGHIRLDGTGAAAPQIRFRQAHVDDYLAQHEHVPTPEQAAQERTRAPRPLTDVQERYPHLVPPSRRAVG